MQDPDVRDDDISGPIPTETTEAVGWGASRRGRSLTVFDLNSLAVGGTQDWVLDAQATQSMAAVWQRSSRGGMPRRAIATHVLGRASSQHYSWRPCTTRTTHSIPSKRSAEGTNGQPVVIDGRITRKRPTIVLDRRKISVCDGQPTPPGR
ncbi:hypothetical protein K439DRAFT_981150 [Ramaria rubella]|nr:hypothetical protein K439DRAFT_981150 [Ramaria rubella]